MKLVELSESEFRNFEQNNKWGNLYQMAERAEVRRKMGWECELLGLKDGKAILAACLLMIKDGMGLVAMGPILDYEDEEVLKAWVRAFVDYGHKKDLSDLEVFPPVLLSVRNKDGERVQAFDLSVVNSVFENAGFVYEGETTEIENKANRWVCVKDLRGLKTIDDVRATYKKNVRNKLRKYSPELEVHHLKREELSDFVRAVNGSDKKNGVVSRKVDYWEKVWDAFGDDVHFVTVRTKKDKKLVCGRVFFEHPNEIVTFVSGTVQEMKKYNGMTFIQDWTLNYAIEQGYKRVNFYGMKGDFTSANHLLEFKSGFKCDYEELLGGYRLILKKGAYYWRETKKAIMLNLYKVKCKLGL